LDGRNRKKNTENAKSIKKQIVKKMSKIIKNKKKQIVDRKILKKKISRIYIFVKELLEISRIR